MEIAPSIDCVALANTGVDALLPLIFGLAILALGVTFFVFARGRLRGSGVALGLVLLLAGGAGLAVTAPASSASADDCTPLDYQLNGERESPATIESGDQVLVEFWLTDVVDRDGTPPIAVTIPKAAGYSAPTLLGGANWTFSDTTNNYLFTYSGALGKGDVSSIAGFGFTLTNEAATPVHFDIPISIVTGSGGDTNTANNTVVIPVDVNGSTPLDYALDLDISAGNVNTGQTVTLSLQLENVTDRDGTTPLVVRIPRQNALTNVTLTGGAFWTLDSVSDSANYVFTYTGPILANILTSTATITFVAANGNSSTLELSIPATIDTGSGGDTNTGNNSEAVALLVQGTPA